MRLWALLFAWGLPMLASASPTRLALLIGHNSAGGRVADLRYAHNDIKKIRDVLLQVAGYRASSIWMLKGPTPKQVYAAMKKIKAHIRNLRRKQNKRRIFLLVYYSGHAKRGRLLLGKQDLPFRALRSFLKSSGASLRLAVLDACETGGLTRRKGLRRKRKPVQMNAEPTAEGEVIITASGERESAHEDPQLRGGIFTHYFVSGLRGAADRDRNGRVTLDELYRFSYNRTLERTLMSAQGPQHARYSKRISGVGQLVLASLRRPQAWIEIQRNVAGAFYIWNKRRDTLLAEVNKFRGRRTTIALAPGKYALVWRRHHGLYTAKIKLKRGQRMRLAQVGRRVAFAYGGLRKRGGLTQNQPWRFFDGQMEGLSLDAQYRLGFSGIDGGVLHQGPSLGLFFPTPLLQSRLSLGLRLSYQWGQASPSALLSYDLHMAHVDLAGALTLFQRRGFWLAAGLRLRATPIVQVVLPRDGREGDTIASIAWGSGLFLSAQVALFGRWFLSAEIDAGVRLLQLSQHWQPRWALAAAVGLGRRF